MAAPNLARQGIALLLPAFAPIATVLRSLPQLGGDKAALGIHLFESQSKCG